MKTIIVFLFVTLAAGTASADDFRRNEAADWELTAVDAVQVAICPLRPCRYQAHLGTDARVWVNEAARSVTFQIAIRDHRFDNAATRRRVERMIRRLFLVHTANFRGYRLGFEFRAARPSNAAR